MYRTGYFHNRYEAQGLNVSTNIHVYYVDQFSFKAFLVLRQVVGSPFTFFSAVIEPVVVLPRNFGLLHVFSVNTVFQAFTQDWTTAVFIKNFLVEVYRQL